MLKYFERLKWEPIWSHFFVHTDRQNFSLDRHVDNLQNWFYFSESNTLIVFSARNCEFTLILFVQHTWGKSKYVSKGYVLPADWLLCINMPRIVQAQCSLLTILKAPSYQVAKKFNKNIAEKRNAILSNNCCDFIF